MNSITKYLCVSIFSFVLLFSVLSANISAQDKLTKNEYTVLKVCEGIIQLFKQSPETVWPGYNLADRPFIVYLPGKWALLLNYARPVEGFLEYPKDWPALGCALLYHKGQYKDLVGQLEFDFQVDTVTTVAIGFPEETIDSLLHPAIFLFSGYVHEAFHQFQKEAFGEIPWEREEQYPILERENTALAYIEMRILMDALREMKSNNEKKCREYTEQFVAIRLYRWQNSNPFIARYEQAQEINEGTAQYVQMKSIAMMKSLKYKSSLSSLTSALRQDFETDSFPDILISDMLNRMTENSIRPEDMLRNRIYPVGSAMGFLLDYFHIDWKNKVQQAGSEITFAQLFTEGLGFQKNRFGELVNLAKITYYYDSILSSTNKIIGEYLKGYNVELTKFEAQKGYRIQIDFVSKSLTRSRSSNAKKWLVEKGTQSLCSNYQVYTLKNNDMLLQIQNSAAREYNDWDSKKYSTIFFASELPNILLDGQNFTLSDDKPHSFQHVEFSGTNFKFTYSKSGTITLSGKKIILLLNQ